MASDSPNPLQDLLERARSGDREAYDDLFSAVADRLLSFVRLRMGPSIRRDVDSLDVVQEVYLEAHRSLDKVEYRSDAALLHWMCQIAEHRLFALADHHNAKKRRPPQGIVRHSKVLASLRDSRRGPATRADELEEIQRFENAVSQLDDESRELLLLRHFQGLTLEEVAERADSNITTVRRKIGRATAKLGTLLSPSEGETR